MADPFAVSGLWSGKFDEASLKSWVVGLRHELGANPADLGLVFISPRLADAASQVLELLQVHGRVPLLAGCSGIGLISGGREAEEGADVAVGLYSLPGATLKALHISQQQVEEANGPAYWHLETGVVPEDTNGWLAFADPFQFDAQTWLVNWNEAYTPLPILGGLATGDAAAGSTQVYLNREVHDEGAVAVSVGGAVRLAGVISQGCTPIGDTWTITRAERNFIQQIGNRPAYQVLVDTVGRMSDEEKLRLRGNLFVGLVINEYVEDFKRGDFLIRNVMGADPKSGVIAIGAVPRVGQSMQFQRRDAAAATEDMAALLARARQELSGMRIYGGCLCCCNGRGQHLFRTPDHDAGMVQERLGPLALTGFFCNGEIGPVGDHNFLHGYTASLALFVEKPQP